MQKTKPLPSGLTYASWPPPTCEHLFCAVEEAAGCQEPTQLDTGPWVGETGWVVCHGEPTAKCTCGLQLVAGALPSEWTGQRTPRQTSPLCLETQCYSWPVVFRGLLEREGVFFQRVLGSPVTNHLLRRGIFPINFILWSFSLYCPSFSLLGRFPCLMTVFKHVCCCSWNTPLLLNPGSKKSIIYLTSWNFGGSLHLSGLSTKRLYSASLPGSGLWICVKSHPSERQDLPECRL